MRAGTPARKATAAAPAPTSSAPQRATKLITDSAIGAMQAGEVNAEGAILHAAVRAWYEGHIEGSPGCDFRGEIPHQRHEMINPDLN
jgi:hypothetical protein